VDHSVALMEQIFRPVGSSRQGVKTSDHAATKLKITPTQS